MHGLLWEHLGTWPLENKDGQGLETLILRC